MRPAHAAMKRLGITALGVTSSVGRDAASSAASIRAGIVRPANIHEFAILDQSTQNLVPVTGHPVASLTDGFVLFGRWMQLARSTLQDLFAGKSCPGPGQTDYWNGCALLLATCIPDETTFLLPVNEVVAAIQNEIVTAIVRDLDLPIQISQTDILPFGHTSCAMALKQSLKLIGTKYKRVVVLAIDSLIDPLLLENLYACQRLKTADNPTGLVPGEAGVALLVEDESSIEQRAVTPLSWLCGLALSEPYGKSAENEQRCGQGLSQSFTKALDQVGISQFNGDLYVDLNGEEWRARHLGTALNHILHRYKGVERLPCLSVGDIGAASGALGICLAARSFVRGYARNDAAAVLSVSENLTSSCIVLRSPNNESSV